MDHYENDRIQTLPFTTHYYSTLLAIGVFLVSYERRYCHKDAILTSIVLDCLRYKFGPILVSDSHGFLQGLLGSNINLIAMMQRHGTK